MFEWNDASEATLKQLWDSGMSATDIGSEMGGLSRNAILGKAHRMRLPKRRAEGKPRACAMEKKQEPSLVEIKGPPGGVSFIDLRKFHCREVVGWDPNGGLARYCGTTRWTGSSYCRVHHQKNHVLLKSSR